MRRLILNLIIAVVLAGSVMAYAELGSTEPGARSATAQADGKGSHHLRVRGHVDGLHPGGVERMPVKVRNRYRRAIVLRKVRAIVRDAGPGCPRQSLWTRRFSGRRLIRAHRSRRVRLAIGMQADAPDACQGARFPLRFRARGTARR